MNDSHLKIILMILVYGVLISWVWSIFINMEKISDSISNIETMMGESLKRFGQDV